MMTSICSIHRLQLVYQPRETTYVRCSVHMQRTWRNTAVAYSISATGLKTVLPLGSYSNTQSPLRLIGEHRQQSFYMFPSMDQNSQDVATCTAHIVFAKITLVLFRYFHLLPMQRVATEH